MSKIVCKIEMFDLSQKIFLSNNGELTLITDTTIEDLPSVLTDLSWQTEIPKIVLYGNKFYAQQVSDKTLEFAKTRYAMNNLEIEVL